MPQLRDLLKRLAFVGLRPEAAAKLPVGERLRRRFDRFANRLAGNPPPVNDPFYESNRRRRQNTKAAILLGTPCVLAIAVVLSSTVLARHKNKPVDDSLSSKFTPSLYNEILRASELEVSEMYLETKKSPPVVRGSVRNNSNQKFESAMISFNVTDKDGMLLGAVSTTVRNIPPHGSQEFTVTVPQKDAAMVLVRDARRL